MAKIPPGVGPRFPQVVVLVGATGDLSRRKLIPGLLHLASAGFIPALRIVGMSLDALDAEGFRKLARAACDESARKLSDADWNTFAACLDYVPLQAGPAALADAVTRAERSIGEEIRRLHYLSVPPGAALSAVRMLGEAGLVENSRIVMEKPFGTDLASAQQLNAKLHEVFDEEQIFRIDHFLGKEPAQNILAFRFANGLFEPIWNRNFIDHVQIDVPETLALGKRTAFYEATGAYRDMVVTHLFQILGFVAMEAPTAPFTPRHQRREGQGVPQHAAHSSRGRGARPVHRISQRGGRLTRIGHRDLHRAQVLDRQLALGRRAVLSAHRQAPGRGPAHHLDRVSRAAEEHVSRRTRASARKGRITSPSISPMRRARRCRSTASGPVRACDSINRACSSPCTTPVRSATCSKPTND